MLDKGVRNIIMVVAAAVVALIALGFVSTLLTAVVPLAITALVAFVLGRLSANVNLLDVIRSLRARSVAAPAQPAAKAEAPAPARAETAPAARLAEPSAPASQENTVEVLTAEQLSERSKRLEEEVARRSAGYDPRAALEERKKRLLGDKQE